MKKDESGSFLSKEELQNVRQETERAPDEDLTFAAVFSPRQIANKNATTDEYFIAEDDEGAAELVTALEDAPQLTVSSNRVTYPIYKTKLQSYLAVEDIEASRAWGTPLNLEVLTRVKRKVDEKINALAYIGDEKFGVPGIVSGSGFTAITGTDWSAANLDIANEVISYMNQMPRIYRKRSYSLVMADAEWQKLQLYFNSSSSVGDRSHQERIRSAYPNLAIVNEANMDAATVLYDGSTLAAGIAMFIPKDPVLVRMAIAKAPYTLNENLIVDEKLRLATAARIGIVETPFPTSVGKVTGLQG